MYFTVTHEKYQLSTHKFLRAILIHTNVMIVGNFSKDASFVTYKELHKISHHYIFNFMINFWYILLEAKYELSSSSSIVISEKKG